MPLVMKGDPLVELSTGDVIRAPFPGVVWWCMPTGSTVRVGNKVAMVQEVPTAARQDAVILGTDLDTQAAVTVTTKQLCSGCYVLGVQGTGKSSLLEQIACQLLDRRESVIVFDPHGQLIDNIVGRMPLHRLGDTYHLDLKDRDYPFGLNVFACANPDDEEERDRTRNQVTHAFEKLWPETRSGVYFKKLLRHVIILLIERPQLTLADVPRLLRVEALRTRYTERLRNTGSRDFWRFDYGALSPARQLIESGPLLTRVDELLAEPVITRILCQPQSTINIRSLIEQRKNLLVRLPINEDAYAKAAGLVGTMLMAMVYAATFSFTDVPEEQRPGFSLIVDEFQNFATDEYARLFAQGRKFGAKQFLAHQYRDQLAEAAMEANKSATLTAQTKVVFAVTKADASVLADDFVRLAKRRETVNLDMAPARSLDRHPNPVVKEFAARYVWKLEKGANGTSRDEWLDFGAGRRWFNPAVPGRALELLNELLYKGQKERRLDEGVSAKLLAAMKPLLGHDDPPDEVWDTPAYQDEHRQLSERLSHLHANKPKEYIAPSTVEKLLGRPAGNMWREPDERLKDETVALCLPSFEWLWARPYGTLTRNDSQPADAEGRVAYVYTGDPADIAVPLLHRKDVLSNELLCDARRMLAQWLRDAVNWWANPVTGRFERVTYTVGGFSGPHMWLRDLKEAEETELGESEKALRNWKRAVSSTQDRLGDLVREHRRLVPREQKELLRFRRDVGRVLEALLEEPIRLGQSKVTSKEVAETLQHLPRRQAYVRIGTAAHAMETLPLGERVDADEERRRFRQLREQTRRQLCRHVSELAIGGGSDEPGAAGGLPKVDPRPAAPPQPETSTGSSTTSKPRPRLRRSRPLP